MHPKLLNDSFFLPDDAFQSSIVLNYFIYLRLEISAYLFESVDF